MTRPGSFRTPLLLVFTFLVRSSLCGCATAHVSDAAVRHNEAGATMLAGVLDHERVLDALGLDDAEASFRLALELAPGLAEAHANLGLVLWARGDRQASLASLHRALELDPDLAAAHVGVGLVLAHDRPEAAIAAFERALGLQPELVEPRWDLIRLLLADGRYVEARTHVLRLLRLDADRPLAFAVLVSCELHLGRPSAALARLDQAESEGVEGPDLDLVRAMVFHAVGRHGDATALFRSLARDARLGEEARLRLLAAAIDDGDESAARSALAAARNDDPSRLAPLRREYDARFAGP